MEAVWVLSLLTECVDEIECTLMRIEGVGGVGCCRERGDSDVRLYEILFAFFRSEERQTHVFMGCIYTTATLLIELSGIQKLLE